MNREQLEKTIEADPENETAWLAYATWLREQGDPRGELIVLHHENKKPAAKALIAKHKAALVGSDADDVEITWRLGFWDNFEITRSAKDPKGILERALAHSSARFLRAIGIVMGEEATGDFSQFAPMLAGRTLPMLIQLVLNDVRGNTSSGD